MKKKIALFDLYLCMSDSNNRPPLSIPTIKQTTHVDFQFFRSTDEADTTFLNCLEYLAE